MYSPAVLQIAATTLLDVVPVRQPIADAGICQWPQTALAGLGVPSLAVLMDSPGPLPPEMTRFWEIFTCHALSVPLYLYLHPLTKVPIELVHTNSYKFTINSHKKRFNGRCSPLAQLLEQICQGSLTCRCVKSLRLRRFV